MKAPTPDQQRAFTLDSIRRNPKLLASIEAAAQANPERVARAFSADPQGAPADAVREMRAALERPAARVAGAGAPPPPPRASTEAIIRLFGRPVLFVRHDGFDPSGTEYWDGVLTAARDRLLPAALSIGRIDVGNVPGYEWLGTGWLIEDDVIVTNRHVAEEFARQERDGFVFGRSFLGRMSARIDFREEFQGAAPAEFEITQIIDIVPEPGPDMALLRLRWTDDAARSGRRPIDLLTRVAVEQEVAIIGYPAKDSRTSIPDDMDRIYGNIYDVKRLAPGEISFVATPEGYLTHDCTTLGGNSGSAVIDLATGDAVGLHFAGLEQQANYAVLGSVVQQRLAQVRSRSRVVVPAPAMPLTEQVSRQCRLSHYTKIDVPSFSLRTDFVAYATPDSTYAVTRRFIEQAQRSILIGIYDFSAGHLKTLVLEALDRGVEVGLMLDIDSEEEGEIFKDLRRRGVDAVPAPSCASEHVSVFPSSHEKVIIIDESWTLVQSGNWSNNSIPRNEEEGEAARANFKYGNRDMGLAVKSAPLARFLTGILRADMQLERDASGRELPRPEIPLPPGEFLLERPSTPPPQLFASKRLRPAGRVSVRPVLSPDNYVETITALLENAEESIEIEQQYIKAWQPVVMSLCEAIATARRRHPGLEVRIVIAAGFDGAAGVDRQLDALEEHAGATRGTEVRILNPAHFVHCHNKLLIVDRRHVLISSQNWSDFAVSKNREAGLLIDYPDLAEYYGEIFESDWDNARTPDEAGRLVRERLAPEMAAPGVAHVRVARADFEEV